MRLSSFISLFVTISCLVSLVSATHFRYQTVSTKTEVGNRIAQVQITQAWRRTAFGVSAVGNAFTPGSWNWGDGSSSTLTLVATAIDFTNDWVIGTVTLSHTYPSSTVYTMAFTTCCRISTLRNGADGNVDVTAQVYPGTLNNGPTTALPPIVQVGRVPGVNAFAFTFIATDPNFNPLSYSLSTTSGASIPSGFAINSQTGDITWTRGSLVLGLYAIQILIHEQTAAGVTQVTAIDFLINLVESTNQPPVFVAPTPVNNAVVGSCPSGVPAVFQLQATDADSNTITLSSNTAIQGAVLATTSSVAGTVTGTMTYTPLAQQGGSNLAFSVTATDSLGASTFVTFFCFVPVPQNDPPVFVAPSPGAGSTVPCPVGSATVFSLKSTDPNGHSITLSLVAGTPGVLASVAAISPVTGTLSITPTTANYGQVLTFNVRAVDQLNAFTVLTFFCQVDNAPNTPPHFEDPTPDEGDVDTCGVGAVTTFDIKAIDDEGHTVTLALGAGAGTAPTTVFASTPAQGTVTGTIAVTPTQAQLGTTITFQLTATDQIGAVATRTFQCQVLSGSANAKGDPQFAGFQGQSFQFHGLADENFNLISSPQLELNSHFVYLSSGSCTYNDTLCFQHPGTYLDVLGFRIPSYSVAGVSSDVLIRITAGSHQAGLRCWISQAGSVETEVVLGKHSHGLEWTMDQAGNKATLTYNKAGQVTVQTNMFHIQVVNSDFFFNLAVSLLDESMLRVGRVRHTITDHSICSHDQHGHAHVDDEDMHMQHDHGMVEQALMHKYHVDFPLHGLIGQTWRNVLVCGRDWMGTVQDYVVSSVFGQDHFYYFYGQQHNATTTAQ